ncbi:MAG: NAD+ synthase [Actinomycetales bacterium]|nr:NAD+ synthase [Actinomycetales bacterium]
MATLRTALVQINPVVGDLDGNAALVRFAIADAVARGARLIVLPEMVLTGYPVEDLALRPSFQSAARDAVHELARDLADDGCGDVTCLVGYLDYLDDEPGGPASRPRRAPVNAAAVIRDGSVAARYVKHHLPNYGVFDEARYFVPGNDPLVIDVDGVDVSVAICEDLWQEGGPVAWTREAGAPVLAVLNASPYERDKDDVRLDLCERRAREAGATILYANIVGAQDELVFDGDSLAVAPDGTLLGRAAQFESGVLIVDVDTDAPEPGTGPVAPRLDTLAEVYGALVLGLRDYVDKNGFPSVILGLSGGIDSALVAALSVDAFGPERVFGVALPSVYSSEHSVADAYDLADRTGLSIRTVPIAGIVDAFQHELALSGLAEENLQARVRGTTLMALSNAEGHLVLATGNKSELSVGYSTIYGDAVGGFAPIKDVPKTLVWELARWRNAHAVALGQTPPIPPNSIEKPPSAELRPDQKDTDSLPDYLLLDQLLDRYVAGDHSAADLVGAGFDSALVERILRLTDLAEYKRRQYPPGTKISLRAFGRDRRLPITSRWRESAP